MLPFIFPALAEFLRLPFCNVGLGLPAPMVMVLVTGGGRGAYRRCLTKDHTGVHTGHAVVT